MRSKPASKARHCEATSSDRKLCVHNMCAVCALQRGHKYKFQYIFDRIGSNWQLYNTSRLSGYKSERDALQDLGSSLTPSYAGHSVGDTPGHSAFPLRQLRLPEFRSSRNRSPSIDLRQQTESERECSPSLWHVTNTTGQMLLAPCNR